MTTYRPYRPGADDATLLRLRANVWGVQHPHTNQAFLHWLYVACPAGSGGGLLALDGDEAMGFAGTLARVGYVRGHKVRVAQCVDYMMHSDARGGATAYRIIVSWTKQVRDMGFDFGIGFPNINSHDLVTRRKVGWVDAFWPEHLIRPLSRAAAPQGMVRHVPMGLVRGATGLATLACRARAASASRVHPPGRAVRFEHFDQRFDALWQAAAAGNGHCGLVRDAAYLNWRYRQHPAYRYQIIGWEIDDRLVGWMVTSTRQLFDVPSLLLVDLLVDPKAPAGVAEVLIEQLCQPEQARCTPMLHALAVPGSRLRASLARLGFLSIPRRFNPKPFVMVMHDLAHYTPFYWDWHQWEFRWGDTDVV